MERALRSKFIFCVQFPICLLKPPQQLTRVLLAATDPACCCCCFTRAAVVLTVAMSLAAFGVTAWYYVTDQAFMSGSVFVRVGVNNTMEAVDSTLGGDRVAALLCFFAYFGVATPVISVAMLAVFQRCFNYTTRLTRFLSSAAYAVYLIHPLVVTPMACVVSSPPPSRRTYHARQQFNNPAQNIQEMLGSGAAKPRTPCTGSSPFLPPPHHLLLLLLPPPPRTHACAHNAQCHRCFARALSLFPSCVPPPLSPPTSNLVAP